MTGQRVRLRVTGGAGSVRTLRFEIVERLGVGRQRPDDGRIDLGDLRARGGHTIFFQRVVGEQRVETAGLGLPLGQELLEHLRHAVGIDAGPHELLDARGVGLRFVVPAELREHRRAEPR